MKHIIRRPVTDEIIDPPWGQNIADNLNGLATWAGSPTFAAGAVFIPASTFGLTTVEGAVASVAGGSGSALMVCNAITQSDGVWIGGFTVQGTTIVPWGAGAIPIRVIAWGTSSTLGSAARPADEDDELEAK